MRKITIEMKDGEVVTNIDGIDNFTDILVCLATLEGIAGGIMNADKTEIRVAVDEIQKDLSAQLPEDKHRPVTATECRETTQAVIDGTL